MQFFGFIDDADIRKLVPITVYILPIFYCLFVFRVFILMVLVYIIHRIFIIHYSTHRTDLCMCVCVWKTSRLVSTLLHVTNNGIGSAVEVLTTSSQK